MTMQFPSWMIPRSGYVCERPYPYEYQSEVRKRSCGKCERCIAAKKRDVAGRCAAEAYNSPEVMVWTLTYREGEAGAKDFVTKDRQDFLGRMRMHFRRIARKEVGAPKRWKSIQADHVRKYWLHRIAEVECKIRYVGCGERGKRNTKRCHWHLVFFLSKRSGFTSTPRQADGKPGRENKDIWPHGFVNIDVHAHDIEPKMKAVRYSVKYLDKSRLPSRRSARRGDKPEAMFFRSTATPLGYRYLVDEAKRYAQAGLPIHGKYTVPGVRFSKGDRKHVEHVVTGVMRDHYIAAYREEWENIGWNMEIPNSDFVKQFDQDAEFRASPQAKAKPRIETGLEPKPPVPKSVKRDRSGTLAISLPKVGFVGIVEMRYSGFCQFLHKDGTVYPIPNGNVRDFLNMDHFAHVRVEEWIKKQRGPDWVSRRERAAALHQRYLDQREAILRWAKCAPKCEPAHVEGLEPMTATRRKLLLNGQGHEPGSVVIDPSGKPDPITKKKPAFHRPKTGLLKSIDRRIP